MNTVNTIKKVLKRKIRFDKNLHRQLQGRKGVMAAGIGLIVAISVFLTSLSKWALIVVMSASIWLIYDEFRKRDRLDVLEKISQRFRWSMVLEVAILDALIIGVGVGLNRLPGFDWGWIGWLTESGSGLGVAWEVTKSRILWLRFFPSLFFLGFLALIPFLAYVEEWIFRRGKDRPKDYSKYAIAFGLAHTIIGGVPIGWGIALITLGIFLGHKYSVAYRRYLNEHPQQYQEAIENGLIESTTYHSINNALLIAGAFLAATQAAFTL
ncbi:MAG: hypothetical protein ACE5JP_07765 [Candidatus Bipolaricaulia bacterium]